MSPAEAQRQLRSVASLLSNVLASDGLRILEEAAADLERIIDKHRGKNKKKLKNLDSWTLRIDPRQPLRFKQCTVRGHSVEVDLYVETTWPSDPDGSLEHQNLAVRVWALDPHVCYRADWDSDSVRHRVTENGRRVMLRWHLDQANDSQPGPRFHLQIGGASAGEELCWLHPGINLPRFAITPTDLILGCEMILANFYPDSYLQIRKENLWQALVRESQEALLESYLATCTETVNHGKSLLDAIWNVSYDKKKTAR